MRLYQLGLQGAQDYSSLERLWWRKKSFITFKPVLNILELVTITKNWWEFFFPFNFFVLSVQVTLLYLRLHISTNNLIKQLLSWTIAKYNDTFIVMRMDMSAGREADWRVDEWADRRADRQIDGEMEIQIDRFRDRQARSQTDRQREKSLI